MVIIEIEPSPTDDVFRKYVRELIDLANREILVIAGELGSYRFPDLRWAFRRAINRGVRIRIYASNPPQEIINGLLAHGCEIYVGKEVKRHYLIVDSKSWVYSSPHPRGVLGVRCGKAHINEPENAKKKVNHFNRLVSKAKKIKTVKWDEDPLWTALKNPPDWGVETDSLRLEEELF
jgi:hypothetical protein